MKMKMAHWIQNPKVYKPLLCVSSGILLCLCFPPYHYGNLIFVALFPVLISLKPGQFKFNFLRGFLTGISFYLPLLYWIGHAIIPGMLVLVIYVSILFSIPFAIYYTIPQKWLRPLLFGFIWGLIEYIRTLGYFSFAWGFLGHNTDFGLFLVHNLKMPIPIISGLIAIFNSSLFELIQIYLSRYKEWKDEFDKKFILFGFILLAFIMPVLLVLVILISSKYENESSTIANKTKLKIALLQGNFGMEEKDLHDTREAIDVYLDLAKQSLSQSPDLIILPESAISVPLNYSPELVRQFSDFVNQHDVEMLVGAVHGIYEGSGVWKFWNRAYLFQPGQSFDTTQDPVIMPGMQTYDKMHLVPYGEWIPGGNLPVFGWIETLIEEAGAGIFQRGTEQTIFVLRNGAKFSVAICFESTLSDKFRTARRKGADFIVNITNDAWFKRSPGLAQHFLQCQFRAAENDCFVVRCANTGITAVIDPNGKIQSQIPDNEVGYLVDTIYYQLPALEQGNLLQRHG